MESFFNLVGTLGTRVFHTYWLIRGFDDPLEVELIEVDGKIVAGRTMSELDEVHWKLMDEDEATEWGVDLDVDDFAGKEMSEQDGSWLRENDTGEKPFVLRSALPHPMQRETSPITGTESLQYLSSDYPELCDDLRQLSRFWPFL